MVRLLGEGRFPQEAGFLAVGESNSGRRQSRPPRGRRGAAGGLGPEEGRGPGPRRCQAGMIQPAEVRP